jgi:formylglycine-generating enzyme required for sulfatase activity
VSASDRDLTLALAKAQANLDLIASRSDVLSDLGDLKEVKRLESECALLIRDHAKSGRVPPDPLAALESEVVALIAWGKEVQAFLDEGLQLLDPDRLVADDDTADKIGRADIEAQQAELNTFRGLVADRTAGLAGRRPTACFTDRGFDPRVADLWRIRAAGRTRGGVGLGENIPSFDAFRRWVDSPGGRPSAEQRALLKRLDDRVDELATYATKSAAERAELVAASAQLETGNPKAARALAARPRAKRYADPLWSALVSELAAMDAAIAKVEGADGLGKVVAAAEELSAEPIWAKVEPESELGASLRATADKARRGRKMRRITLAVSVAVLCVAGVFVARQQAEAAAKAKVAAEAKRVAAVKLQPETDAEERRRRKAGEAWAVEGLGLVLVPIAGGTFSMGSLSGGSDEQPVTTVTLSPFWLAKTEVTQASWEAVMGSNPSYFKGGQLPVENVSWGDAMEFCRKLTERERQAGRLPTGTIYTLPTEAQWEYACRAGTTGDYAGQVDAMAWYDKNSGAATHAVATKQANAWGMHDMHGNVGEWCEDWYADKLPGGSVSDFKGAASGSNRIYRGGGWGGIAAYCRSAYRSRSSPGLRFDFLGFRLALSSVP